MCEAPSNPLDTASRVLSASTTGVSLLAALGFTTGARSLWRWLNRSPDDTFLIALAAHAASIDRATVLNTPPDWMDPATSHELRRIARELTNQANGNIRLAIARRDWARSKKAGVAPMVFALAVGSFFVSLGVASSNTGGPSEGLAIWSVGSLAVASLAGVGGMIARDLWCASQVERELPDPTPAPTQTGPIGSEELPSRVDGSAALNLPSSEAPAAEEASSELRSRRLHEE